MLTLDQRLDMASKYLQMVLQTIAPIDTGNLAFNGIRLVQINIYHYQVWIGGEVAPYAIYTNEKANSPHKDWIDRGIAIATPFIQSIMGGEIPTSDIEIALSEQGRLLDERADILAALRG